MMWYGGSKMHEDSKVIRRLAQVRQQTEGENSSSAYTQQKQEATGAAAGAEAGAEVLLFVRLEGEPYCCLGRVRWVGADLLVRPPQFKWWLQDFPRFQHSPHFKRILQASGGGG